MKIFSTVRLVVAIALVDSAGRVLMQRRRSGGEHGGLWEFPGGKVESGESPEAALIREIDEELGLDISADYLVPLTFAGEGREVAMPIVILLYTCRRWTGEPECRDADAIAWFDPQRISALDMPPLDIPLARAVTDWIENSC